MEYIWYIVILGTLALLQFVVMIFAKDPIKLRLKAAMKRKKNYIKITELDDDRRINTLIVPYENGMALAKNKRYGVDKEHIHYDPVYNIPAAVVSYKKARSIDPANTGEDSPLSPETIDNATLAAIMGPEYQFMKKLMTGLTIGFGFCVLAVLGCCVVAFMLINGAKEAGMTLTF